MLDAFGLFLDNTKRHCLVGSSRSFLKHCSLHILFMANFVLILMIGKETRNASSFYWQTLMQIYAFVDTVFKTWYLIFYVKLYQLIENVPKNTILHLEITTIRDLMTVYAQPLYTIWWLYMYINLAVIIQIHMSPTSLCRLNCTRAWRSCAASFCTTHSSLWRRGAWETTTTSGKDHLV